MISNMLSKPKISVASLIFSITIFFGSSSLVSAQQPLNCNALVSANSQLYTVSSSGAILTQFAVDSSSRSSVALSPDGKKVAYIPDNNPNTFSVIDSSGRSVTTAVPAMEKATLMEVSWDKNAVLKVRSHIGRDNDLFQFYSVPTAFMSPLTKIESTKIGQMCSTSGSDNKGDGRDDQTACLSENLLVVGKKIIANLDPLSSTNATLISNLSIQNGSTGSSQTSPSFQVRVLSVLDGVTLQVTLPNGEWSQSTVPFGAAMPISWDDGEFGVVPVSFDSKTGTVAVKIVKSSLPVGATDTGVTWINGKYVGIISRNTSGAQFLLTKANGDVSSFSAPIDIQEPVISLNYIAPGLIGFRTAVRFGVFTYTFTEGPNASMKIGTITTLPTSVTISLQGSPVVSQVNGWACH